MFTSRECAFAALVRQQAYANPFAEEVLRLRAEIMAFDLGLGEAEQRREPVLYPPHDPFPNCFARRAEALLECAQERLRQGMPLADGDKERYEDLVISALTYRHFAVDDLLQAAGDGTRPVPGYRRFAEDFAQWTRVPFPLLPFLRQPAHAFAIYFQLRRAWALLWELIQGGSRPAARLRADIWHSIFPRELRLYGGLLYERMHEVTTLILGPSGTGKELVATAIGLGRFVPFDPRRERFTEPFAGAFHPLNLSAMPRDLVESEMFGHVAGAFTGATKDRAGWFEKSARSHTVFLDEIGELAEPVQVKLLRVLQSREFYRVGDAEPRRFEGRVIAATNRDLAAEIAAGRFREDLFFRLCSDVIRTPTLREQLDDSPAELPRLIELVAARCLGAKAEPQFVADLTRATQAWIEQSAELGPSYAWPGNFRELEQCVRSVMVRGEYHPPRMPPRPAPALSPPGLSAQGEGPLAQLAADVAAGRLTFDELLERYCSLAFARAGNVAAAAKRLKKHRATVQSRIRPEWVARFREGTG